MGFLLLQLANFTYAAGQVLYKHLVARHPSDLPHYRRFGLFLPGRIGGGLPAFLMFGKSNFPARSTAAMGRAAVPRPGLDRAGPVLVEQGRVHGQRRDAGGDEQPACAGGAADQSADLESA